MSRRGDNRWQDRRQVYLKETGREPEAVIEGVVDAVTSKFRLKAPRLPKLLEDDIEQQCKDLLGLRGWWVGRLHSGTFKSIDGKRFIAGHRVGTPDYICCHKIHPAFFLETKRPGATPTPDQFSKQNELKLCFGLQTITVDRAEVLTAWLDHYPNKGR